MPLRPSTAPLQYQQCTAPCAYQLRGSLFLVSLSSAAYAAFSLLISPASSSNTLLRTRTGLPLSPKPEAWPNGTGGTHSTGMVGIGVGAWPACDQAFQAPALARPAPAAREPLTKSRRRSSGRL